MIRALIWSVAVAHAGIAPAAGDRPNVVFFLVDDLHARGTGASGHPFAITPNIDRIADEGIRFDNAHVTTPLCSPSRASFLSGMYARAHGVLDNGGAELDPRTAPSFPQYLQAAGYATAFVGKWHQYEDDEPRPGFDLWAAFRGQGQYVGTPQTPIVIRYSDGAVDRRDVYIANEYNTDLLTGYALDWLASQVDREPERPFCLLLWYKAVHGPRRPADRHAGIYAGQHVAPLPPATVLAHPAGKPERVASAIQAWNRKPLGERQRLVDEITIRDQRTLAAVDESVGAVLALLEAHRVLDDTVVIFASDNGYLFYEFGLTDKRWQYEPSTRIPLFVRYPRLVAPGSTSDLGILNVDVAPTVLDLARLVVPARMQGASLKGIFDGSATAEGGWRRSWLTEYFEDLTMPVPASDAVAVARRRSVHKLTSYSWRPFENEIYELAADPDELDNLVPSLDGSPLVADLRQERARLVSAAGGPTPAQPFLDLFAGSRVDGQPADTGRWLRMVQTPDGLTVPVTVEGRRARQIADGCRNVYLDIEDDWVLDGDRSVVDVTVVYHDHGAGRLRVEYDARDPAGSPGAGIYRPSSEVRLEDSGAWRRHTFRLVDAVFRGRQDGGADLRIAVDSTRPVSVDTVAVRCPRPSEASIDLGEPDASRLLYRVETEGQPATVTQVGGRECRRASGGGGPSAMSFAVADELVFAGNAGDLVLALDYYDAGRGLLVLEVDGRRGPRTVAGSIELGDTRTWRRHRFVLRDWLLANRQPDGADLRVTRPGGLLIIDRVSLDRLPPARSVDRR